MGKGELLMEIYDAMKAAVMTLREQKLMYREQYKLTASRADGQWVFWFVFLPETPGMDVTAIVDDGGNVKTQVGI